MMRLGDYQGEVGSRVDVRHNILAKCNFKKNRQNRNILSGYPDPYDKGCGRSEFMTIRRENCTRPIVLI